MIDPPQEIHWNLTATARTYYPELEGDIKSDVVVVGGGLTGCRTALGLAEAGLSVVLLETNDIGWGASGRSGGQCNPVWRETPAQLEERFGAASAERLITTTVGAADDLFHDIKQYGIECDSEQNGWVQAAHTSKTQKKLDQLCEGWQKAGADIERLEGEQVEKISGSGYYSFALFHRSGGHVQPLSLTRGYASAAHARGAQIFCGNPVENMIREGTRWRVKTSAGSVSAEQVVLTTNAYTTPALWPGLQQTFLPLVSISVATAPLSKEQQATVLPGRVTISDSRLAIYYSRYDRDNRLIFGCVGSSENVSTLGGHKRLREGLHAVFPQLTGIPLERTWAGRIAMTPEMMPHVHELAPGVTAGLGFSGRGIAMTSVMGRTLTRKLLGDKHDTLAFPVLPLTSIRFHGPLKTMIPFAAPAMSLKDKFDTLTDGI